MSFPVWASPDDEAKLRKGSYEDRSVRIHQAFRESRKDQKGPVRILGTFEDSLVVLDVQGASRVRFTEGHDGSFEFHSEEPLSQRTFTENNATKYVYQRAEQYVDAWRAGLFSECAAILRDLAPRVSEDTAVEPTKLLQTLSDITRADSDWRKTFFAARPSITKLVGEALQHQKVGAKFRVLYTESRVDTVRFRSLVDSDLNYLSNSLRNLAESAESSVRLLGKVSITASDPDYAVFESLVAFANSLSADLNRTVSVFSEARTKLGKLAHLGELHDIVAPALKDFETAARFVEQQGHKLQIASVKE